MTTCAASAVSAVRAIQPPVKSPRYVAETATTFGTELKPTLVFRLDRYLRGGDHSAFNREGFAGVRFTEYRENYNHQHQNVRTENGIEYGDLAKFVDYDYVAKVARLNAATLASLASAPAPPGKVWLQAKELQNDSTLTWEAVPRAGRLRSALAGHNQPDMGPLGTRRQRDSCYAENVEGRCDFRSSIGGCGRA